MIQVSTTKLRQACRFLGRLRYEKNDVPVLRHVLGSVANSDFTLVAAREDLRLEYRVRNAAPDGLNTRFLIPAEALRDASEGGPRSLVRMEVNGEPGQELLTMAIVNGVRESSQEYPIESADSFPEAPAAHGPPEVLPQETIQAVQRVAPFASKDIASRAPICGVYFSPSDGGMVIATDVKQLAIMPAKVPDHAFLLPNPAVQVLDHDAFSTGDVDFIQCRDGWVGIRREELTLFAKTTAVRFPDHRPLIQLRFETTATIPASHIPPLVAWLLSLKGASACVQLGWDGPNHLSLTARNARVAAVTTFELPVELEGRAFPVFLTPSNLANALTIGCTMRFAGPGMPCLVTGPAGETCAIMPRRPLPDA